MGLDQPHPRPPPVPLCASPHRELARLFGRILGRSHLSIRLLYQLAPARSPVRRQARTDRSTLMRPKLPMHAHLYSSDTTMCTKAHGLEDTAQETGSEGTSSRCRLDPQRRKRRPRT